MPVTSFEQQRLAEGAHFLRRVRNALAQTAFEVLDEDTSTASHLDRAAYARKVLAALDAYAEQIAKSLVVRPALTQPITYDYDVGGPVSAVLDDDMQDQIAADWNKYAGVE